MKFESAKISEFNSFWMAFLGQNWLLLHHCINCISWWLAFAWGPLTTKSVAHCKARCNTCDLIRMEGEQAAFWCLKHWCSVVMLSFWTNVFMNDCPDHLSFYDFLNIIQHTLIYAECNQSRAHNQPCFNCFKQDGWRRQASGWRDWCGCWDVHLERLVVFPQYIIYYNVIIKSRSRSGKVEGTQEMRSEFSLAALVWPASCRFATWWSQSLLISTAWRDRHLFLSRATRSQSHPEICSCLRTDWSQLHLVLLWLHRFRTFFRTQIGLCTCHLDMYEDHLQLWLVWAHIRWLFRQFPLQTHRN